MPDGLGRERGLGGTYWALRNSATGKCLDVNAGATTNGAWVQQWDCNSTNAQAWKAVL